MLCSHRKDTRWVWPTGYEYHYHKLSICIFYQILKPPAGYQPIRTPARKLSATPTPMGMSGFRFQMEDNQVSLHSIPVSIPLQHNLVD